MTHLTTWQSMPTVQVTCNRNRLKIYDKDTKNQKVYLRGGSHFELEFFNPLQERIGLKIYINGNHINDGRMLIINPGQRGFLERYLDDSARKFLFDTYTVNGDNEQVKKAIEKNGLIKVEFFKEQFFADYSFTPDYNPNPWVNPNPWNQPNIIYGNGTTINGISKQTFTSSSDVTMNFLNDNVQCDNSSTSNFKGMGEVKASYSADINMAGFTKSNESRPVKRLFAKKSKEIETGRIAQGEHSEQRFDYTTFNQQLHAFHTVELQIMPESTKQLNVNEQTKRYCPGCRFRIRDVNWKFCCKCGLKLE